MFSILIFLFYFYPLIQVFSIQFSCFRNYFEFSIVLGSEPSFVPSRINQHLPYSVILPTTYDPRLSITSKKNELSTITIGNNHYKGKKITDKITILNSNVTIENYQFFFLENNFEVPLPKYSSFSLPYDNLSDNNSFVHLLKLNNIIETSAYTFPTHTECTQPRMLICILTSSPRMSTRQNPMFFLSCPLSHSYKYVTNRFMSYISPILLLLIYAISFQ